MHGVSATDNSSSECNIWHEVPVIGLALLLRGGEGKGKGGGRGGEKGGKWGKGEGKGRGEGEGRDPQEKSWLWAC